MGEEVLKKFGRYFLLDTVAQGGMAEIFRARLASAEGAGRLLCVKRIQAGYSENKDFISMFQSEIKVTMGFGHPNIVQLYDFGKEGGQHYIAMELVEGKSLREFLRAFGQKNKKLPIEIACYVIEQAAAGLHYAHAFKDKITGEPLGIVHRDISPQNILVSYDGNVKVIDFGIAKAKTNTESTRAGVIKGKPSYLSPEQISGEQLDGRSDIFALGIVLWESLTMKKLFAAADGNEFAVLKLIESCQTYVKAPSTVNPDVPKELDYIVLKCLAKDRNARYATAEDMQRALHKFVYSYAPDFSPNDLAYYCRDLFKEEIVEDRKRLQKLNARVESLMAHDIPEAPAAGEGRGEKEDTTTVIGGAKKKVSGTAMLNVGGGMPGEEKVEMEASPGMKPGASSPGFSRPSMPGGTGSTPAPARSASQSPSRPAPPRQSISRSKGPAMAPAKIAMYAAAALGALMFLGPEVGINIPGVTDLFSDKAKGRGPAKAQTAKTQTTDSMTARNDVVPQKKDISSILLRLNVTPGGPAGAQVSVNGQGVDGNPPAVRVPIGQPLELAVDRTGFKAFRRQFVLDAAQMEGLDEWLMDVPLEPVQFGFLTIHTTPSADAHVRPADRGVASSGEPWVLKTPIENEKFPVGTYEIRLINDVLGMEKSILVKVEEGKSVRKSERLEIKH